MTAAERAEWYAVVLLAVATLPREGREHLLADIILIAGHDLGLDHSACVKCVGYYLCVFHRRIWRTPQADPAYRLIGGH